MTDPTPPTNVLLDLLDCQKRREFEKLCDVVTLTKTDFSNFVAAAMIGSIPHRHRLEKRNLLPAHMEITDADRAAAPNTRTHLEKIGHKLGSIFDHPRSLLAHFFWLEDGKHWWLVLFNYLEIGTRNPGWVEGSHVHLLSYLTHPLASPNDFLEEIMWSEKAPDLPHPVHIRFQRDA